MVKKSFYRFDKVQLFNFCCPVEFVVYPVIFCGFNIYCVTRTQEALCMGLVMSTKSLLLNLTFFYCISVKAYVKLLNRWRMLFTTTRFKKRCCNSNW